MADFSKRTNWTGEANEWSRLLARKKASGEKLWDLTASNPTRANFAYTAARVFSSFSSDGPMLYEPDPQGLLSARQTVSDYYQKMRHAVIPPDDICLTPGTSDGYNYLFRLLTDPGDEMLVACPGYPLFDMLASLNDCSLKQFRLTHASGVWRVDWASLENSFSDRTKAVLIVHPNNPTGHYWSEDEKTRLEAFCVQKNCALIVDEVFWDYVWERHTPRTHFADTHPELLKFTLSGISKVLGLPQMKLSWLTVHGPKTKRLEALRRLQLIGDSFLSVSTPIQLAAADWFRQLDTIQAEILDRVRSNRRLLAASLSEEVGTLCEAGGGWYAVLALAKGSADDAFAMQALEHQNVVLHPGYFFDFPQGEYLVLSLLTPPDVWAEGLKRIALLHK